MDHVSEDLGTAENAMASRGTIGIITGSGPAAGMDMMQKVLDTNIAMLGGDFKGDTDTPPMVVLSVPQLGFSMDMETNCESVWVHLHRTIVQITAMCDVFCIACNTLHYFEDRIHDLGVGDKFVSFVDVVADFLESAHDHHDVALLGSRQTMDQTPANEGGWSPYFRRGIELEVPDRAECDKLHSAIHFAKKCEFDEAVQSYVDVSCTLVERNVRKILLACTELPLIHDAAQETANMDWAAGVDVVDVSNLVARELLVRTLQRTARTTQPTCSITHRDLRTRCLSK